MGRAVDQGILWSVLIALGLVACGDAGGSDPVEDQPGGKGGTAGKGGTSGQNGKAGEGGTPGQGGSSGGSPVGGAGQEGGSGGATNPAGGNSQGGSAGASALDCSGATAEGWQLCEATAQSCGVVFNDSAGCQAVCEALGLGCLQSHENADGSCGPDTSAPPLGCAATGHKSDYCVCGKAGACTPSCEGKACGGDGCGGVCGACKAGEACKSGVCMAATAPGEVLAFKGAEGEGRHSKGGRGGDVYHVTNLKDSGAGSLREGVKGSGPRTIVFDVAGIITLGSPLAVSRSRLTIAGQTAPGGGVVVRGYQTLVKADDVVIRHVRFRAGDLQKKKSVSGEGFTEDSLTLQGQDIIADHLSASWGIDESLSGGHAFDRVTVQYSIISEGLHKTCLFHGEYDCSHSGHSMGSLFKPQQGDARISVHHNLYASNNNRNPAIGTYDKTQSEFVDLRNNVIYNCPNTGYSSEESKKIELNYVGNYMILGPASNDQHLFEGGKDNNVHIFQSGNYRDTNKNGAFDGKVGGWELLAGSYTKAVSAFDMEPVTTHPAPEALSIVLAQAGAMFWKRDQVDARIVSDVKSGKGKIINSQEDVGGWGDIEAGAAEKDSDGDGMPDFWEKANGLDASKADNNADADGDGYTNLEAYLDERANP